MLCGPRFGVAMMDAVGDGIVTSEEVEARLAARSADAHGGVASAAEEMIAVQDRKRKKVRPTMVEATIARMDDNGDGRSGGALVDLGWFSSSDGARSMFEAAGMVKTANDPARCPAAWSPEDPCAPGPRSWHRPRRSD